MPADSALPPDADPANRCLQMRRHLEEARELLCLANRRGVRIPD
jgi:hypothetical protein